MVFRRDSLAPQGFANSQQSSRRQFIRLLTTYGLASLIPTFLNLDSIRFLENASPTPSDTLDPDKFYILINAAMSGEFAFEGAQQLMAAQMAVQEINESRWLPKQLSLLISDNRCSRLKTMESITQALESTSECNIKIITGGSSSYTSNIQQEIAASLNIIHLHGISQASESTPLHGLSFSAFTSIRQSANCLFAELQNLQAENIFAISHNYPWGHNQASEQRIRAENLGLTYESAFIDIHHSYFKLSNIFKNNAAVEADAIIVNQYGHDLTKTLTFLKQSSELQSKRTLLPILSDATRRTMPHKLLSGVQAVTNWNEAHQTPNSQKFIADFQRRFRQAPGQAAQQTYAQLMLYAHACRHSQSCESSIVAQAIGSFHSEDFFGLSIDFTKDAKAPLKNSHLVRFGENNSVLSYKIFSHPDLKKSLLTPT